MKKKFGVITTAAVSAALLLGSFSATSANAAQKDDKTVTIYGAFGGNSAKGFQAELNAWSLKSGIKATYVNLPDFNTQITVKIKAGQSPDIAIWPQPGGLKAMAPKLVALNDVIKVSSIQKTLIPGWDQLANVNGKIYGLPIGANIKSLVWYNPAAFKAAGYTVPKTDAELMALTDKIRTARQYPWCASLTGWHATDWLEEYVLRYGGVKTYNDWAAGKVKYSSAVVKKAAEKMASYLLTEGNVQGGGKAAAADAWNGSFANLFKTDANQCFLIRQGSFIQEYLPTEIQKELADDNLSHANVFSLPTPAGASGGTLGGGDLAAALNKNKDTAATLNFILSDQLGRAGWANSGFFYSAHKTFPSILYPSKLQRNIGAILAASKSFGFDQSDMVPPVVSDEESKQLVKWLSGETTLTEALAAIDASWK